MTHEKSVEENNHVGKRFGKLVVINILGYRKRYETYYLCKCDCGNISEVRGPNLSTGHTKSCGCGNLFVKKRKPRIWNSNWPEYIIWAGLKARCNNKRNKCYSLYGGRGIKVSSEWNCRYTGFDNFLKDMGRKPSPTHSVDRINNDKGYSKENCRWATPREQVLNSRVSKMITHNGKTQCVKDWAKEIGVSPTCLSWRLKKWTKLKALTNSKKK